MELKGPVSTKKKISSDKKISFALNPLVAHVSSQDKEKLSKENFPRCKPALCQHSAK